MPAQRYSYTAITLHWLIALLLAFQIALGWALEGNNSPELFARYQLHKSVGITILLLSQLNRASTQRDEPQLTDLKESGAIEEDADVVILLQPKSRLPDGSLLVAAILAKNRQGRRTRVALAFRGEYQQWVESTVHLG